MSFCKHQLRDLIARTLKKVPKFYSADAVELLMMTAAAESDLGHWLFQDPGPAKGMMQVEPATMVDNYENYLSYRPDMVAYIADACGVGEPDDDALEYNMAFNILMARLKYYRSPLPVPDNPEDMAKFHEDVYNAHDGNYTHTGKKDWEVTLSKYEHFCQ